MRTDGRLEGPLGCLHGSFGANSSKKQSEKPEGGKKERNEAGSQRVIMTLSVLQLALADYHFPTDARENFPAAFAD